MGEKGDSRIASPNHDSCDRLEFRTGHVATFDELFGEKLLIARAALVHHTSLEGILPSIVLRAMTIDIIKAAAVGDQSLIVTSLLALRSACVQMGVNFPMNHLQRTQVCLGTAPILEHQPTSWPRP